MRARRAIAVGLTAAALAGCGARDDVTTVVDRTPDQQPAAPAPRGGSGGDRAVVGDGTGGIALERIGDFDQPVYVTQPPTGDGDHLYFVEQCGTIERIPVGGGEPSTFLDLSGSVTCGGEQGLLSVAFSPDYARSGKLYVNYTDTDGNSRTVEYRRAGGDPPTADPDSARELLEIDDFASNHNGGLLLFGPDERLYLGMGDGGGAGDPERTAQDPSRPLGKLLVIDPRRPGEFKLAAIGLRNPWRYSFDRKTGDVWIGDVGQDTVEEIDAARGDELGPDLNFGWSAYEADRRFNEDQSAPGAVPPVYSYGHDRGCSVTGGYVVRDPALKSLAGRYLYGDYCEGALHSFPAAEDRRARDDRALGLRVDQLSSFGEDVAGHVYAVSLGGPVYRLMADQ
jgi:glucose/arabinose dehydrogenase